MNAKGKSRGPPTDGFTESDAHIDFMHKKIARYAKGKVLDIGFNQYPNRFLDGAVGADIAAKEKPENYSKVAKANSVKLPFPDKEFDTVIASELLNHVENPMKNLREWNRVLKMGGRLIISTVNPFFLPLMLSCLLYRKWPYYTNYHIADHTQHNVMAMLELNNFRLVKAVGTGASSPVWGRKIPLIPLPRCMTQNLIYVAEKAGPPGKEKNF